NVANILFSQGKESEALNVYDQIMDADPHYHSAYYLAARISESRGRLDEAINQYTQAYELSPSDQYAVHVANLYTDLGEYDKSWQWIDRIETPAEPVSRSWVEWVKIAALTAEGRKQEALPMQKAKLTTADEMPDSAFHQEDAAAAAYLLEDVDLAIHYFEKVPGGITLKQMDNSNRTDAMFGVAFAYQQRNQPEKAEAVINDLREFLAAWQSANFRQSNHYWYMQSKLALLEGEPRLALVHLQRAIDEGWRTYWLVQHEPVFAQLKSDPAFSRMIAGLETRMDIMREQLALASTFETDWSG
ncbi:MAG: tetratricopeptide repeat protein, partial [Proteobacteria bacterium]|nr:tetratricopeptide repeat protein [Pseudomonadota bacterium]